MGDSLTDAADLALLHLGSLLRTEGYRFTTITPASHARVNARPSNRLARDNAGVFGWSRAFERETVSAAVFDAMEAAGILQKDGDYWRSSLRLSSLGDLLFFHSAFPTDAKDAVFFGPDSYRFAAAIQNLLDEDIAFNTAIDVGCGAGVGAILVAAEGAALKVIASDINDAALRLTQVNAALNGVTVTTVHSDILESCEGSFELILANPPYIMDAAGLAYRDGGSDFGAGISMKLIEQGHARLAPEGRLLLYTGSAIVDGRDPLREWVEAQFPRSTASWEYGELDPDVFGEELSKDAYETVDRIAVVVLDMRSPAA
ncbi:MAG: HemK family modification methylase [Herminiimonas sp.]|nr:HemK family modification methylase [Herminiimonas sp.]